MQADPLASFWEANSCEPNRWDRLRDIFEKLRIVLEVPGMCPGGADDLLEQLELRLDEAAALFPESDWLLAGLDGPEAVERYCGNHVGMMLGVLAGVAEALARQRAREPAAADRGESGGGA